MMTDVMESVGNGRNDDNSLLEASNPCVPLIVLEDGVYLGLAEIQGGYIHSVVTDFLLKNVVYFHSTTVGTYINFFLIGYIEALYHQILRMRYGYEFILFLV